MSGVAKRIMFVLVILLLVAACARSGPTATPAATSVSPTAVPLARSTATALAIAPEPGVAPTEIPARPTAAPTTKPGYFSRDELIEDARQLAEILESTHPDPYIRGGGKVAFNRRLQRLLNATLKTAPTSLSTTTTRGGPCP